VGEGADRRDSTVRKGRAVEWLAEPAAKEPRGPRTGPPARGGAFDRQRRLRCDRWSCRTSDPLPEGRGEHDQVRPDGTAVGVSNSFTPALVSARPPTSGLDPKRSSEEPLLGVSGLFTPADRAIPADLPDRAPGASPPEFGGGGDAFPGAPAARNSLNF
jgi:hypothetical protein